MPLACWQSLRLASMGEMAIRIRQVSGVLVALCAAETDAKLNDIYLDDEHHYALAAKFSRDWAGQMAGWEYPEQWAAMDTQKLRDAEVEISKYLATNG